MTTGIVLSLIGLIFTIISAVWKLSKTITECTDAVKNLTTRIDNMDTSNEKDHIEMWDKIEHGEEAIQDHETRIALLEHTKH